MYKKRKLYKTLSSLLVVGMSFTIVSPDVFAINNTNTNKTLVLPKEYKYEIKTDSKNGMNWYVYKDTGYKINRGSRLQMILLSSDMSQIDKEALMQAYAHIAEQDQSTVVFVEAPNATGWTETDVAFIEEFRKACTGGTYYAEGASRYLIAYGDAGIPASIYATQYTANLAGIALLDAEVGDVDEEIAKNLPLAVLVVNGKDDTEFVEYFKKANRTDKVSEVKNEKKYYRSGNSAWNPNYATSNYVRLVEEKLDPVESAQYVWDELSNTVRRWTTISGVGTLREKNLAEDMGMVKIIEQDTINNLTRDAVVYVPESVKKNPDVPHPMVTLFHGSSGNGEYLADQTDWYKVAEEYGFIFYAPTSPGVNGKSNYWITNADNAENSDIKYYISRYKDIYENGLEVEGVKYAVNENESYATGFSIGAYFTLALSMYDSEIFTAIAPMAGVDISYLDKSNKALPVWFIIGDQDYLLPGYLEGSANLKTDLNLLQRLITHWCTLAETTGMEEISYNVFNDYLEGKSVEMETNVYTGGSVEVRYTLEHDIAHGLSNEFSWIVWEDFFSRYTKDTNGKVIEKK